MSAGSFLTARWEVRLRPSRPPLPRPWRLALSLALHLAVLLLLVFGPQPRPPPEPMLASPIAMMFEPPRESRRAAPHPSHDASLASPPAAAPQTRATLPAPATSAAPAPPHPAPHPTPQPAVRQPVTPPPGNDRSVAAVLPLRLPPPNPPTPSHKPAPPRRPPPAAFPAPMQFSLGRPQTAPAASGRGRAASYGPAAKGALSYGRFAQVVSGHVDPSWIDQLHHWWDQHGYYPEQAVMNREDGTVGIQIVVDRYGHVRSVEKEMQSGSQWLDMAAQAVFRGAHLPPLPPDTQDQTITVYLNISYVLLGR